MGGESKGKEPQKAQAYIPHKIHKRKASIPQRKLPRKGSENTKKENWEELKQALSNHAESSTYHEGSYKV
jgi:L-asparaginase/Glu-tRNA(Gln) amidotransferase subunit D